MHRYSVAQARIRLAEILNAAERGQTVIIERRGVRFTLAAERSTSGRGRRSSIIDYADRAVTAGTWTWAWGSRGLRFSKRGRAR